MKNLSLRIKILFSVGLIIFFVLGTSTFVHIQDLKQDYLEAIEWRSEALAQSIVDMYAYISYEPGMLVSLQGRCEQIHDSNKEKDVTHVAVITADGIIVAHSDDTRREQPVNQDLYFVLGQQQAETSQLTTILSDSIYHTIIPIFATQENTYIGSVDVGFPKEAVDAKIEEALWHSLGLFVLFVLLAFFTVSLLIHFLITQPVKKIIDVGQRLAEGGLVQTLYTTGRGDEIAILGTVFYRIAHYLQHVAEVASQIANGVLSGDVRVRSANDMLGHAVQEMLRYLKYVSTVATKVSEGDLTETVQVRSQDDAFGRAIQTMTEGLRTLIVRIRDCAEQIAQTGLTISSSTEQDINLAERVYIVTEHMMGTMREIGASVEEVAHSMTTLSSSVQETSDSVLMITASITHIALNATELTKRSHKTIEAMENAMSSLENVVKSTDVSEQLSQETIHDALEGQKAFDHVMTSMQTIQDTITSAVDSITGFERQSRDIDTILDVIRDITEQTGLLALNASIIAAQAGEHGRGFAVVAEEIKNLAQEVGNSTKNIADILHTLQRNTHMVVQTIHEGDASVRQGIERTQQAQESLQKIINSARRSSSVVSEIAEALRKVMVTSHDVVTAMEEVNEMTDDFTVATNEQEMSTEQINNSITQINTMSSHIQQTTDKQLSGVHQMLDAANDVTALIDQNLESSHQIAETTEILASQADILMRSVDRFKLAYNNNSRTPSPEEES